MHKKFWLDRNEICEIAPGHGGCIATDRITVDGQKVGFMYREHTDRDLDSGWRFMAGDETQEFMDNANNHGVYDVNTIANYHPDIVPMLDAPFGSAFERQASIGPFTQVPFDPPDE